MAKDGLKINGEIELIDLDLAPAINGILKNIGIDLSNAISKASPVRTGKYASGWTYNLESSNEKFGEVVIYNDKRAPLTHLLELGHRSRAGRNVPPQEHIRPAYNRYKKIYLDQLKEIKFKNALSTRSKIRF